MTTKATYGNMLNEYVGKIKNYISPWTEMKPTEEKPKDETKFDLNKTKVKKFQDSFSR